MIIEKIDNFLRERPKDKRAIHCFHPSTLHKPVDYLFKAYFEGNDGNAFDPRVLRVFDNGHQVHDRLQKYLHNIGILKELEVPIENKEYEIRGHTDGILEIESKTGVLEIKSINSMGFYSLYQPKNDHLIQINIYMFCLDIPRGLLLYENKDNQELKEFFVKQDPLILNPILDKIRIVQGMIQKGSPKLKELKNLGTELTTHG
jgi:hypothetical protein